MAKNKKKEIALPKPKKTSSKIPKYVAPPKNKNKYGEEIALPNAKQKPSGKISKYVAAPKNKNKREEIAIPNAKQKTSSKIPKYVAAPKNKNKEKSRSPAKIQAIQNTNVNIKKAGADGNITKNEIKKIESKSNLSSAKVATLINKSDAKTSENVGSTINRRRLSAEEFNANKDQLKTRIKNVTGAKDPYTGETNVKRLDNLGKKLENYGVSDYKPSKLELFFHEKGKDGTGITEGKLNQLALNNPEQANYMARLAGDAGVTLKSGDDITKNMIRGYRTTAEKAAEKAADPVTQADNQVLDIKKIMEGFQTMLTNSMSNQPDIGALLRGVTDSQNAMFGNMMNNNRIQQSQMNPMRMSPVLGIRSAGMQNYGLNNATNAFGRGGTRFGGLKNNSLNLS